MMSFPTISYNKLVYKLTPVSPASDHFLAWALTVLGFHGFSHDFSVSEATLADWLASGTGSVVWEGTAGICYIINILTWRYWATESTRKYKPIGQK